MKKILLVAALICLILLSACRNDKVEAGETETAAETTAASIETTETTKPAETTLPSETTATSSVTEQTQTTTTTGSTATETEAGTDLLSFFVMPEKDDRPFAIMIDNEGTKSYPQGGLEKAQIVYELIAEWGETRLMPIIYGPDKGNIGPVRSIRHYFIQFAMEYDPVLVHIGYSPQGQTMIKKNNLANINGLLGVNYSVFFDITKERDNWQDTYTKLEYLTPQAAKLGYRSEPAKEFPFAYSDTALNGSKAEKIHIVYSKWYNCGFEYDEETGLYARLRKGTYHRERYTGNVLAARNIIIHRVKTYPISGDKSGRMTMDIVGSGKGLYMTGGKSREIVWEKNTEFGQTTYKYADNGEKITLNEGQTWIMVVGTDTEVIVD